MSICELILEEIQANIESIVRLRKDRTLKADGTFVTRGDLLCQDIVIDCIRSVDANFLFISEEMKNAPLGLDAESVAVIDPIDGTENFTSGLGIWGVSVSIYRNGRHTESLLALPELGQNLTTGQKIERHTSRIYGLSSSLTRENLMALPERTGFEYRIMGCAVYNFFNVIRGSYAVFENFNGAYVWDILAGLNLALEHQLCVEVEGKTYRGELLKADRKYRFKIWSK